MSPSPNANQIIYSSDITIEEPRELSALCVFYDRVALPYVVDASVDSISFDLSDTRQTLAGLKELSKEHFYPEAPGDWGDARSWDGEHRALFDASVIVRLDPPQGGLENFDEDLFFDMDVEEQFLTLAKMKNWVVEGEEGDTLLTIRPDLIRHLCRTDLRSPEIHVCGVQPASREIMKFLEVSSVLSYFLPKLTVLNDEQILEVLDQVKKTREGFSMHLQTLSKEVEQRLKGGEPITEIGRFAKSVVETDLIPDYAEFRRQLTAERRSSWATAPDAAGKIIEIDASPTTPKFWGAVLQAVGVPLIAADKRKEQLSNKHQALQFMKSVESSSVCSVENAC
jgi:hypothetical protein